MASVGRIVDAMVSPVQPRDATAGAGARLRPVAPLAAGTLVAFRALGADGGRPRASPAAGDVRAGAERTLPAAPTVPWPEAPRAAPVNNAFLAQLLAQEAPRAVAADAPPSLAVQRRGAALYRQTQDRGNPMAAAGRVSVMSEPGPVVNLEA